MKLNLKTTRTLTMSALFALALTACGQTNSMSPMQVRQPVRMQSQQVQTQAAQVNQSRQLIVRFRHEMSRAMANEFNAKYGLHIIRFVPEIDAYIVELDSELGLKADRVISFLKQDPMVSHAEVNVVVQLQPSPDLHTMPIY